MTPEPDELWCTALSELEIQMTRATFDTWLHDTRCLNRDGDTLIIAVKNSYAADWLGTRLYPLIQRTLHRITGNGIQARFIVDDSPPPPSHTPIPPETWTPPAFDPGDTRRVTGWIPIPEYAIKFWAPLLGQTAWRVWEIVRQSDRTAGDHDWTPRRRWSAPELARLVPCGKQALVGRNRRCDPDEPGAELLTFNPLGRDPEESYGRHYPGAFDKLQQHGVAEIEQTGHHRHTVYTLTVRWRLPLLHPTQVAELRAELQTQHDAWVAEHGLDPELWQ